MSAQPGQDSGATARLEAAMEWMFRLRDKSMSDARIEEWLSWCEADSRNQEAFDEALELWSITGGLREEFEAAGPLVSTAPRPEPHLRWITKPGEWLRAGVRPLAFAGLVAAVIGLLIALRTEETASPAVAEKRATEAPVIELVREVSFDDGSQMQLATGSKVEVRYSANARALTLERGEALFTVARDEKRPFIVDAGEVRISALGTAFNVRRADQRVVVTVTQGKVAVDLASDTTRMLVSAGSQLQWGPGQSHPILLSVDPDAVLGWRQGRLAYTDEPLAAVIADYNRYAQKSIRIGDEAARALSYTGTLFTQDIEEWRQGLAEVYPVTFEDIDGGWLLRSRDR